MNKRQAKKRTQAPKQGRVRYKNTNRYQINYELQETRKKVRQINAILTEQRRRGYSTHSIDILKFGLEQMGLSISKYGFSEKNLQYLKNTGLLENALQDPLNIKFNKVKKEIVYNIFKNPTYRDISDAQASTIADIFQTDIYHKLLEIGLLDSDQVIDYVSLETGDLSSRDVEKILNDALESKKSDEVKDNQFYSYIVKKAVSMLSRI